jgi:hypothetical protein
VKNITNKENGTRDGKMSREEVTETPSDVGMEGHLAHGFGNEAWKSEAVASGGCGHVGAGGNIANG